jgi:hypothetical protein
MCAGSYRVRIFLEDGRIHGRIVQQAERIVPDIDEAVKEVLVEAHTDGYSTHHLYVNSLALVEEVEHARLEFGHGGSSTGARPLVGMPWVAFAADFEALFQIGRGLAQLAHVAEALGGERDLLTARRRVAAVGLRRRPSEDADSPKVRRIVSGAMGWFLM